MSTFRCVQCATTFPEGAARPSRYGCPTCGSPNVEAIEAALETPALTASAMTPADYRDCRAKRWQQAWAGVDVSGRQVVPLVASPDDVRQAVTFLRAFQRVVDWYNAGGVSGSGFAFACEALLQRAGIPQTPPCCTCRGTGCIGQESGTLRDCPEGCASRPPR